MSGAPYTASLALSVLSLLLQLGRGDRNSPDKTGQSPWKERALSGRCRTTSRETRAAPAPSEPPPPDAIEPTRDGSFHHSRAPQHAEPGRIPTRLGSPHLVRPNTGGTCEARTESAYAAACDVEWLTARVPVQVHARVKVRAAERRQTIRQYILSLLEKDGIDTRA